MRHAFAAKYGRSDDAHVHPGKRQAGKKTGGCNNDSDHHEDCKVEGSPFRWRMHQHGQSEIKKIKSVKGKQKGDGHASRGRSKIPGTFSASSTESSSRLSLLPVQR